MASANTGGFRLVRCPKCLNILPEPANVSVYQCGGCNTTLRAKVSVSNAQNVAKKQVRQDSDNYSVVTSVSNGVSPENKDLGSIVADVDDSCTPDAPSNETECKSNVKASNESGGVMSDEKNAMEVTNTENKEDRKSDGRDTDEETEVPALQTHPNGNDTHTDSDEEESNTVEQSAENPPSKKSADNPEACRVIEVSHMGCSLNTSEHNKPLSEDRKLVINLPEPENGACQTEPVTNKRTKLVRVQSRSCDLRDRVSVDSLDFQSSRTSFQSKSFRASEPLQSKIMKTVDDLKGDLCEIFNEPSDCKPRTHPPHPRKQDGYMPHVAITSSLPLSAYHPAAKHSGHASRLSRSGQVAPHDHEQPLPRYRRHSAYSYNHTGQMEMMRCPHECCHSYRPPCCSSWKQERALHKPPVKEIKRRPPPRNLCRPVLRGAPFILCSNCLRLVQLPTGFAVPSRGTRRLQCGSCSQVLSYSYRDPRRKKLQSPFGGDESSSTDDYEIHQAADDFNTGAHQADPYSYSEEYGQSAGASYSTEDEQPLHVSRNSSFNTMDERSGKESKLHRLMGYSSASELMRHSPDLYESFSRRTPNMRPHDMKGKGVCVTDDDSAAEHTAMKGSKQKREV